MTSTETWFYAAMGALKASYPEMYGASPAEWKATCKVYFGRLGETDSDVLGRAFHRAQDSCTRFPTLPEFVAVVRLEQQNHDRRQARTEALAKSVPAERQLGEDLGEYKDMTADEARAFVRRKLGIELPKEGA